MHISEINIYPIKSLKGISLAEAAVEKRGFEHDRRWMLTHEDGMFFTQREFPKMATIEVTLSDDGLKVSTDGFEPMDISFQPDTGRKQKVTVWDSICDAEIYDNGVNEWFSDVLGTRCQLAYMPDDSERPVSPRFDFNDDIVSFADGYPLLLIGEGSLSDLNSRLDVPLPMNRFRPNLVVSGSEAFAEDRWAKIRIGDAIFRGTKASERCVITTTDQALGRRNGNEPLRTLAVYRRAKDVFPDTFASFGLNENSVLFGQNLIAETIGDTIKVGDPVKVIAAI